jgi:hypothetical protein
LENAEEEMAEDVRSVNPGIVEDFMNHCWKNSIGTGFSPFN